MGSHIARANQPLHIPALALYNVLQSTSYSIGSSAQRRSTVLLPSEPT